LRSYIPFPQNTGGVLQIIREGYEIAKAKAVDYVRAERARDKEFALLSNRGFSPRPYPNSLGKFTYINIDLSRVNDRVLIEISKPDFKLAELSRIQRILSNKHLEKKTIDELLSFESILKHAVNEDNKKKENDRISGEEHQLKQNEQMFKDILTEKNRIESIWKSIDPLVMEEIERRYSAVNQILNEKQMLKNRGIRVSVCPGEFSELFHIAQDLRTSDFIERFKILSKPYYDKAIQRINSMQNGGKRKNKTRRTLYRKKFTRRR